MSLIFPRIKRGFYHVTATPVPNPAIPPADPVEMLLDLGYMSGLKGKLTTALDNDDKFRITFWVRDKTDPEPHSDADKAHLINLIDILTKIPNVTFGIDATCVGTGKP